MLITLSILYQVVRMYAYFIYILQSFLKKKERFHQVADPSDLVSCSQTTFPVCGQERVWLRKTTSDLPIKISHFRIIGVASKPTIGTSR